MSHRLTVALRSLGFVAFLLAVACLLVASTRSGSSAVTTGLVLLGSVLASLIVAHIGVVVGRRMLEQELRDLAAASREAASLCYPSPSSPDRANRCD